MQPQLVCSCNTAKLLGSLKKNKKERHLKKKTKGEGNERKKRRKMETDE
jgi:hypothetical protein